MPESFDHIRKGYLESRCAAAVKALIKRDFDASWYPTISAAIDAVTEIIPAGSRIGVGGSATLKESAIFDRLSGRGDELVMHGPDADFETTLATRKEGMRCPFYLSSSNAITLEGELLNTDGVGNRVAAMIFGPQTVVVIAGANKIVETREDGLSRIRNIAAPINARRFGLKLPCVEAGRCMDCNTQGSICKVTTILSGRPLHTDMKVLLVAEELGF